MVLYFKGKGRIQLFILGADVSAAYPSFIDIQDFDILTPSPNLETINCMIEAMYSEFQNFSNKFF